MSKNILVFIPARGGSKRLPRKNIKLFCGEPLIAHTIRQALACSIISRVIVSTDDEEIKKISLHYGAEVMMRPEALATDFASTASAAKHCLNTVQQSGFAPDVVITLQPTNPLRPIELLNTGLKLYFDNPDVDSVISVTKNKLKLGEILHNRFIAKSYKPGQRSQDLEQSYFENGLLYLTKPEVLDTKMDIFGEQILPLVVDEFYAKIDIDDVVDFEVAEFLFTRYKHLF